jgi:hypothetical protein
LVLLLAYTIALIPKLGPPMTRSLPAKSQTLFRTSVFAIVAIFSVLTAFGQYGASPSQTGIFFDDFRSRQNRSVRGSGTRDGEVTYDYESGVYRDNMGDVMGQRTPDLQASRDVSRPSVRSGSAFSARNVGDYTNYAGQYASPTGFFAPTYSTDPYLDGRRNIKMGPLNLGFGYFQGFEYNDNVTRSGTNPLSDIISTSMLSIDANYQFTQNNRLSLSAALGVDRYLENPDLAPYGRNGFALNVLPGSTIAFDVKAGEVYFTLYNRFTVRPTVRNDFAVSRNQFFGVFQNDSGLAANWRINSAWSLALNYMYSFSDALSQARGANGQQFGFEEFNRVTNSLHGSLTYSPNGTWVSGFEGGITDLTYENQFNPDGSLVNIGPFLVIPVGKSTYLRAATGAQIFNYESLPVLVAGGNPQDPTPSGLALNSGDQSDLSDGYYSLTLTNRLNSKVVQSLSLGHESSLNLTSNFVTADYVNYGVSFLGWKGSRVSISTYFENAEASGGSFAQDFTQYGGDFYISHRLSSTIQIGLGYHYGLTSPASQPQTTRAFVTDNDFSQQAFNLDFAYTLSKKATLTLGYRYFTTDVKGANELDFDQNRFVFGLNYNF